LCPKLDDLDFDSIDAEKASWLESEVLDVVNGMNSEKALDPKGFSMAFF
jgi:hypothetical protein